MVEVVEVVSGELKPGDVGGSGGGVGGVGDVGGAGGGGIRPFPPHHREL